MFKKLKKPVIDKKKLLLTNLCKKRVNKTPRKILFPNRTNLTFANIIVNMNSTPNLSSIDSWNKSYFSTELYNNSFSNRSKNNNIDISRTTSETKDDHSEILSIIINGILCLKSNDLLAYCTKLIEIMTYIRDKKEKYNYIDINSEMNKDLLLIIYQIYFQMFNENSYIYLLLNNDLNNGTKIFQKIHSLYILYILTGLSYMHDNFKSKNIQFYEFLKQFLKKEKCHDKKCSICINAENYENKNSNVNTKSQMSIIQKPSVIKINDKQYKNNNINKRIINTKKSYNKNNIINNSNDNILIRKKGYNQNIENNYYSNIINDNNIQEKKNIFYMKSNEKEKINNYNYILIRNQKINYKINKKKQNKERNENSSNFSEKIEIKKYDTEINKNERNKIMKISRANIDNNNNEIKIKLFKNINKISNKSKIKMIDMKENNIINDNNKTIESNKINKNQSSKTKTIKIKKLNNTKFNSERKIYINLNDSDKINNNSIDNKKDNNQIIIPDINKSSKIIKENINLIQNEINNFKEHNIYIKQQLEKLVLKSKMYK